MGGFENVCEFFLSMRVLQISVLKSYLSMYVRYIVGIAYKKSYPCILFRAKKLKSFKI